MYPGSARDQRDPGFRRLPPPLLPGRPNFRPSLAALTLPHLGIEKQILYRASGPVTRDERRLQADDTHTTGQPSRRGHRVLCPETFRPGAVPAWFRARQAAVGAGV